MRPALLMSLLIGCSPTGSVSIESNDEDVSDTSPAETIQDTIEDTSADDSTPEEESEPAIELIEGIWTVDDVELLDDVCDWDSFLESYYGISITSLMPSEFDVDSEPGAFEIEARDYGAQGPIDCTIEDDTFTCEAQTVSPLDYDLGSYGWEYRIEWSGEVDGEGSLIGTAVVSYPSIEYYTEQWLSYYGIDYTDCIQTFELVLEADG